MLSRYSGFATTRYSPLNSLPIFWYIAPSLISQMDIAGNNLILTRYTNIGTPIIPKTMKTSQRSGKTGGGTLEYAKAYRSPALKEPTKILILNKNPPIRADSPARAGPHAVFLIGFQTIKANGIKKLNSTFVQKITE